MKIMLVEDEPAFANPLSDMLCSEGMSVTVAADERSAQQCLSRDRYDLVLLDLMLPPNLEEEPSDWGYRTGLRLLRWMRERNDATPVIVLSVVRDPAVVGQAEEYGVVSCIAKPAAIDTILREIRRALPDAP